MYQGASGDDTGTTRQKVPPHNILQDRTLATALTSNYNYLGQVDWIGNVDRGKDILQTVNNRDEIIHYY